MEAFIVPRSSPSRLLCPRPHTAARIRRPLPLSSRPVAQVSSAGRYAAAGLRFVSFSLWPRASQRPEDTALQRTSARRAHCCRATVRRSVVDGPSAGLRSRESDLQARRGGAWSSRVGGSLCLGSGEGSSFHWLLSRLACCVFFSLFPFFLLLLSFCAAWYQRYDRSSRV